jgi:hypothetical protein
VNLDALLARGHEEDEDDDLAVNGFDGGHQRWPATWSHHPVVDTQREEEDDFFFSLPQNGTWAGWFLGRANGPGPGELLFLFSVLLFFSFSIFYFVF